MSADLSPVVPIGHQTSPRPLEMSDAHVHRQRLQACLQHMLEQQVQETI